MRSYSMARDDRTTPTSTFAPLCDSKRYSFELSDVYGGDVLFNPRLPYNSNPVMPHDELIANFLTGAHLGMAGKTPVLCHESAAGPTTKLLLDAAGLSMPEVVTYRDYDSYRFILATAPEGRVVYQHVHPGEEAPGASYHVPRSLLSYLNNKANAAELVPGPAIPQRTILNASTLDRLDRIWHPYVLKVISDESVGGGYGVRICTTPSETTRAVGQLLPGGAILVEEFLAVKRNWCLNFVAKVGGVVDYLGGSEQITDHAGRYQGNFMTNAAPDRLVDLGREIVSNSVTLGYHGFVGIDIVETADGRDVAIDLNFRLNGSTPAVLLSDTRLIEARRPTLYRTWRSGNCTFKMRNLLVAWAERRVFTPVASRFPVRGEAAPCLVSGVLVADDEAALDELVHELAKAGLR
jgi:hypothetical protein